MRRGSGQLLPGHLRLRPLSTRTRTNHVEHPAPFYTIPLHPAANANQMLQMLASAFLRSLSPQAADRFTMLACACNHGNTVESLTSEAKSATK